MGVANYGVRSCSDIIVFADKMDFGPPGQDQGEGGKYLMLPPGYDGDVPDGYFVVESPTNRVWPMMRANAALAG